MARSGIKASMIIGLTISLMLVGILLPIGLADIVDYNGTYTNATSGAVLGVNATVGTLVGTIVPIMAVVGLILAFVSYKGKN